MKRKSKAERNRIAVALMLLPASLAACGGRSDVQQVEDAARSSRYAFVDAGAKSTVDYSGQTLRHLLIADWAAYLEKLTARIDSSELTPTEGTVKSALEFYYRFDGEVGGQVAIGLQTNPSTLQSNYSELSPGKNLVGKVAGNDATGQHKDWSRALVGWGEPGALSPGGLIERWVETLDHLAAERAAGRPQLTPSGSPVSEVYLTQLGLDLRQLLQKFLLGAVAFSQGADDYLDDDLEGSGLLSDNVALVEGTNYTELAHHWDEGFGYFGAARDYADYSDDEIAAKGGREPYASGYHDTDGDGAIDLHREYNFGHAVNAAKRDRDSASTAPTDWTRQAIEAFVAGRRLIHEAAGRALSGDELSQLRVYRNRALAAWERAIAASAVHYINEVLQDMQRFDTEDYDFAAHAKHWSELKGFALSLQFNPHTPLSEGAFGELHQALQTAPVLPAADGERIDAYRAALLRARGLLARAYGFAADNLGDEQGVGGW